MESKTHTTKLHFHAVRVGFVAAARENDTRVGTSLDLEDDRDFISYRHGPLRNRNQVTKTRSEYEEGRQPILYDRESIPWGDSASSAPCYWQARAETLRRTCHTAGTTRTMALLVTSRVLDYARSLQQWRRLE